MNLNFSYFFVKFNPMYLNRHHIIKVHPTCLKKFYIIVPTDLIRTMWSSSYSKNVKTRPEWVGVFSSHPVLTRFYQYIGQCRLGGFLWLDTQYCVIISNTHPAPFMTPDVLFIIWWYSRSQNKLENQTKVKLFLFSRNISPILTNPDLDIAILQSQGLTCMRIKLINELFT